MTPEETQALTETDLLIDALHEFAREHGPNWGTQELEGLLIGAAAALTTLARDLATARQERDAAERRLTDKAIAHESEMDRANRADAAVRAARAETLRKCALAIREGASAGGAHTTTGYVLLGIADVFDATAAREGQ